jgi:hypothetical protein
MADPPRPDTSGTPSGEERALDRGLPPVADIPQTKTSMGTAARRPDRPLKLELIFKKVDVYQLAGATLDPRAEMAAAANIWLQCRIDFIPTFHPVFNEAQTRQLLAVNSAEKQTPVAALTVIVDIDEPSPSMKALRNVWSNTGKGELAVFFAPKVWLLVSGAPSAADPDLDIVYIGENRDRHVTGWTVAHELGHRLMMPSAPHAAYESPLMHLADPGNEIVELECRAARGEVEARFEILKRGQ